MSKKLTLTESETCRLVDAFHSQASTIPCFGKLIRNQLMFLLMLDAGLRVAEVSKLTRGCMLFANHFCESVTVPAWAAKGNFSRVIPSSQRLRNAILEMSEYVWAPDKCPADGFAFYRTNFTEHLTVRQIQRVIGIVSLSTIGRTINPHLLRHTFATRLMRTVNIRVVQELLGHVSISSTQVYTHPNGDDLKKAIDSMDA